MSSLTLKNKILLSIGVLLSLGVYIYLRLQYLEHNFSFDELYSIMKTKVDSFSEFWEVTHWDNNPFGHHLVLWLAKIIFGINKWSVKIPSLIAEWIGLFYFYKLTGRIYQDKIKAVFSVTLLSIFSGTVYYSTEARAYSFLLSFAIMLYYYYLTQNRVGKIVSSIILSWFHYFSLPIIGLVYLFELINKKKNKLSIKNTFQEIMVIWFFFLPMQSRFYRALKNDHGKGWIAHSKKPFNELLQYLQTMIFEREIILLVLICIIARIIYLVKNNLAWNPKQKLEIYFLIFAFPLCMYIQSFFGHSYLLSRYYITSLFPIAIVLTSLLYWKGKHIINLTLISIILLGQTYFFMKKRMKNNLYLSRVTYDKMLQKVDHTKKSDTIIFVCQVIVRCKHIEYAYRINKQNFKLFLFQFNPNKITDKVKMNLKKYENIIRNQKLKDVYIYSYKFNNSDLFSSFMGSFFNRFENKVTLHNIGPTQLFHIEIEH